MERNQKWKVPLYFQDNWLTEVIKLIFLLFLHFDIPVNCVCVLILWISHPKYLKSKWTDNTGVSYTQESCTPIWSATSWWFVSQEHLRRALQRILQREARHWNLYPPHWNQQESADPTVKTHRTLELVRTSRMNWEVTLDWQQRHPRHVHQLDQLERREVQRKHLPVLMRLLWSQEKTLMMKMMELTGRNRSMTSLMLGNGHVSICIICCITDQYTSKCVCTSDKCPLLCFMYFIYKKYD